jgi:hypothetical protein
MNLRDFPERVDYLNVQDALDIHIDTAGARWRGKGMAYDLNQVNFDKDGEHLPT